jgi:hypothetical protein
MGDVEQMYCSDWPPCYADFSQPTSALSRSIIARPSFVWACARAEFVALLFLSEKSKGIAS